MVSDGNTGKCLFFMGVGIGTVNAASREGRKRSGVVAFGFYVALRLSA